MKINFEKSIGSERTNIYAHAGIYELTNSQKYGAAIHDWNQSAEIVNLKTGLVIGFIQKSGCYEGKFTRCWGFRKDLGKNGRVLKSIIN